MIVGTTEHSRRVWARSSAPSMSSVGRHPSSAPRSDTALRRTSKGEPFPAIAGSIAARPGGNAAQLRHLGGEPARLVPVGELSLEQQVPDVLERSPRRQVDGRVLAVMEEPLLPADVTEGGLRRHHSLEPGGELGARARPRGAAAPPP